MANLLPSLSSDDENGTNFADDVDEDEDEEVNVDFGGLAGDGGHLSLGSDIQQGWSYQSALDKIEAENNMSLGTTPTRMDLASIIAAKRQTLKKKSDARLEKANDMGEGLDEKKNLEMNDESDETNSSDDSSKSDASEGENNATDDESSNNDDESEDEDDEVDDADNNEMGEDILTLRVGEEKKGDDSSVDEDEEDEEKKKEADKAAKFFDVEYKSGSNNYAEKVEVFAQLTLSRPILRGIVAMGYVKPTEIQASVIPVALAGRDICASAVTGSGKTAAFLLPILERILHISTGRTKSLILTPTRELAAQCFGMMSTLTQFTKITSVLIVGGSKNMNAQISELRNRPQIIVATPGRLLDHVTNSPGVTLENVEFLVLDEADRLLDLGFQEEVNELIKSCQINRQTFLFSATMNTKVDDLIKLSLKRPVRIHVRISDKGSNSSSTGQNLEVAPRLEQEFVRVRSGNEGVNREAMLLALLTRNFSSQTIVFFDTKKRAHRMMILCGLCGIQGAELHGNLTQPQRLESLEQFRKGEVDILLATDLAARGIDISSVDTVINFEMPNQVETYIHRIGRTARAGRGGRSCTLIGEGRRHLMKDIMKDASDKKKSLRNESSTNSSQSGLIRSRSIPATVVAHFVKKIISLEEHIEEVLQAEVVAKMDRLAEMEVMRAQNIIKYSDEIQSKPRRQWFASEKEKQNTKEAAVEKAKLIAEKVGTGIHRMTRKKRRIRESREAFEGGDDDEERSDQPSHINSQQKLARDHKRNIEEMEKVKNNRSIHEEDIRKESKKLKRKGKESSDALGDSSLFGEEKVTYAQKKSGGDEEKRIESAYHFHGADPQKRKGKRKAHHKFKSKSKYKRR